MAAEVRKDMSLGENGYCLSDPIPIGAVLKQVRDVLERITKFVGGVGVGAVPPGFVGKFAAAVSSRQVIHFSAHITERRRNELRK